MYTKICLKFKIFFIGPENRKCKSNFPRNEAFRNEERETILIQVLIEMLFYTGEKYSHKRIELYVLSPAHTYIKSKVFHNFSDVVLVANIYEEYLTSFKEWRKKKKKKSLCRRTHITHIHRVLNMTYTR